MKRANLLRRWTDLRLARELTKSTRRAAMLAEEINRRERDRARAELRSANTERAKAKSREAAFLLAHRAAGGSAAHG